MTIEEIRKNAPEGATHYFLVPNGSGEPYYIEKIDDKYFYFHSRDLIDRPHIIKWIKPLY